MFLNSSIPVVYCDFRVEYLHDRQSHHGELEPCAVIGVTSIPGRALMFNCITERGVQVARMPLSAFVASAPRGIEDATVPEFEIAPLWSLDMHQLWDSFSHDIAVTEYEWCHRMRVRVCLKDRQWYWGTYLMTFDWTGSAIADNPGDGGHKNAHLIELDNGLYVAQPNSRCLWCEPSMVTKPLALGEPPELPDFKTNTHIWHVEGVGKWHSSDDERMFYDVVGTGRPDLALSEPRYSGQPSTPCSWGPSGAWIAAEGHGEGACQKSEHKGDGGTHPPDYDGPYDWDGGTWCGRCHARLK